MRLTSLDAFVLEVPDAAASVVSGEAVVDLAALPAPPDLRAEIEAASADASAALADATSALAVTDTLPTDRVTWVRTPDDLPAAVGGVRVLTSGRVYWFVRVVDIGTDVLTCTGPVSLYGIGGGQSGVRTASALPLFTGTTLSSRDMSFVNTAGACVRCVGSAPADPVVTMRLNGVLLVGASADGVVQAHNLGLVALMACRWRGCSGVGLRPTGTCDNVYSGVGLVDNNAAGFIWADVPGGGAASIVSRMLVESTKFDLLNGGVGIRANPDALPLEALNVESCLFPEPGTPGIGAPVQLVSADSPRCRFAANNNLENTHVRGALSIAGNATATTVSNATDFFHLAGTTTLREAVLFDSPSPGVLRYTGTGPARVQVTCYVTLVTTSPNQNLQVAFALLPAGGGAAQVLTDFVGEDVTDGTTLRTGIVPLTAWVTLTSGDAVDVRVRNATASNDVTWRHGQVYAQQING